MIGWFWCKAFHAFVLFPPLYVCSFFADDWLESHKCHRTLLPFLYRWTLVVNCLNLRFHVSFPSVLHAIYQFLFLFLFCIPFLPSEFFFCFSDSCLCTTLYRIFFFYTFHKSVFSFSFLRILSCIFAFIFSLFPSPPAHFLFLFFLIENNAFALLYLTYIYVVYLIMILSMPCKCIVKIFKNTQTHRHNFVKVEGTGV